MRKDEVTYRLSGLARPHNLCPADQDSYYTLLAEMALAAGRCDIAEARRCNDAASELALVPYELRKLANRLHIHAREARLSGQHE